ncbi:MAG: winged helix-turn-helix domain-containing protein [Promethearchaeota archaeon]
MNKKIGARFRLWLEIDDKPILGKGGALLLEDIQITGSIHKATEGGGRSKRMSYRYAWGLIRKIEERLGRKIVKTYRGGVAGGGAQLTSEGTQLLQFYCTLEKTLNEALKEALEKISKDQDPFSL